MGSDLRRSRIRRARRVGARLPGEASVRAPGHAAGRRVSIPLSARTWSNRAGYLLSRSRIRYFTRHPASSRSITKFRLAWVTHAVVGWVLAPRMRIGPLWKHRIVTPATLPASSASVTGSVPALSAASSPLPGLPGATAGQRTSPRRRHLRGVGSLPARPAAPAGAAPSRRRPTVHAGPDRRGHQIHHAWTPAPGHVSGRNNDQLRDTGHHRATRCSRQDPSSPSPGPRCRT
jgi:hypothetical protein